MGAYKYNAVLQAPKAANNGEFACVISLAAEGKTTSLPRSQRATTTCMTSRKRNHCKTGDGELVKECVAGQNAPSVVGGLALAAVLWPCSLYILWR